MERRGFFQRLGALIAGAVIAPRVVKADVPDDGFREAPRQINERAANDGTLSWYGPHAWHNDRGGVTITTTNWNGDPASAWTVNVTNVPGQSFHTL